MMMGARARASGRRMKYEVRSMNKTCFIKARE
jgi:hypothetical protein